jgi:hypothetical protein
MLSEGNQIHNFISSSGSGTVINYGSGSGSDFFLNVWWQHATLFDLLCLLYNVHDTGIDVIHYCCMDAVGWKRQEVGLKRACSVSVVGIHGILRSKSVEELPSVPTGTRTYMPRTSEALMAQYLNVRQRK